MFTVVPPVPNFRPIRSTISHFQDIAHFRIFLLDSHVKILKYHKIFKFWQIANIYHNFLFRHDYLSYHKVWLISNGN